MILEVAHGVFDPRFARTQRAEFDVADAGADQAQCRQSDRRGHAAHLAVAAFVDGEFDPAIRHGFAEAHGRIARPQPRWRVDASRVGGQGHAVIEHHAAAKLRELFITRFAFDLNGVSLARLGFRIGETLHQRAFVGEQQQSFAVVVETARRINIRRGDEARERLARRRAAVRELAQHVERFVEGDQHRAVRAAETARTMELTFPNS